MSDTSGSGAGPDPDDLSEALDEDVIDGEYPPERWLGVGERLTPVEEEVGESLRSRVAREEPENARPGRGDELYSLRQLVAPGDEEGTDDEADEVAWEADVSDNPFDRSIQDLEEVQPAEEAAMHITGDPPMHDSDGYLDEEDLG